MAASTRSIHSRQRAAGGKSASSTSRLSSPPRWRRRARGAHRPYSRNVGRPENSRAAPSATSRSNSRRAARPVIGAWRAASAGETQSSASSRSTIFAAGFGAQFGRDGDAGCRRGGQDRRRGRGRRRRPARSRLRRRSARLGRRALAALPPSDRRVGIQNFRRDQRHGPRPAQPEGEDEVEQPEGEDFGFGGWGVREGGEGQGGGLGGR